MQGNAPRISSIDKSHLAQPYARQYPFPSSVPSTSQTNVVAPSSSSNEDGPTSSMSSYTLPLLSSWTPSSIFSCCSQPWQRVLESKRRPFLAFLLILCLAFFCTLAICFNYYNVQKIESISMSPWSASLNSWRGYTNPPAVSVDAKEGEGDAMSGIKEQDELLTPINAPGWTSSTPSDLIEASSSPSNASSNATIQNTLVLETMRTPQYAYATLLSSAAFLPGTLALMHSIQLTQTPHTLVVLVLPHISHSVRDVLRRMGVQVQEVDYIKNPNLDRMVAARQKYNFAKLNIWRREEFDRVVMLDSDMIVKKNIDILFEKEGELLAVQNYDSPFSAAAKNIEDHQTLFNSGLMVLTPSNSTFQKMMSQLPSFVSYNGGDQGFLNSYFQTQWIPLPLEFNVNKMMYKYSRTEIPPVSDIRVIHYVRKKPWYPYAQQFEKKKQLSDSPLDYLALNNYWHLTMDSLKRSALATINLDDITGYDHCMNMFHIKDTKLCLNIFPNFCPPNYQIQCSQLTSPHRVPTLIGRNEDVSVVTQLSLDKLFRLVALSKEWEGPISAALFVDTDLDAAYEQLANIQDQLPWDRLSLHLVHKDSTSYRYTNGTVFKPYESHYPINMLRNVANKYAISDLVFIVDIDFQIMPRFYQKMHRADMRRVDVYGHVFSNSHLNHAFVVPAFEFNYSTVNCMMDQERVSIAQIEDANTTFSSGIPVALNESSQGTTISANHIHPNEVTGEQSTESNESSDPRICSRLPMSKRDLLHRWEQNEVMVFHPQTLSHTATRYDIYANTTRPYYVYWETYYEPYLIVRKTLPLLPNFEEQFVDRSRNKSIFAFELYVRGFRFVVLPETFVIHYFESREMQDSTRRLPMRSHSVLYKKIVDQRRREFNCPPSVSHCEGAAPYSALYDDKKGDENDSLGTA